MQTAPTTRKRTVEDCYPPSFTTFPSSSFQGKKKNQRFHSGTSKKKKKLNLQWHVGTKSWQKEM